MLRIKLIIKYCVSCWITDILQDVTGYIQHQIMQNFSYRCKGKNTCYVTLVTCVIFPVYGHVTELLVVREKHRLNLSENKILQMAFFWPCYSSSLLRLGGGLVDSSGRAR